MNGVLLIDKPRGPTSHDVVSGLRRTLRTKRIGHAGTLDPAATGLLVVLVGEATKLEPYFSACDKSYVADVMLGRATDTLDLEGAPTGEVALDDPAHADLMSELLDLERTADADAPTIRRALAHELARVEQFPPAFSAIKVDGQRSHARARKGERVELPARPTRVMTARLDSVRFVGPSPILTVTLDVAKGYYVRAFARDLGAELGVPAVLSSLRRTKSGPFTLEAALPTTASLEDLSSRMLDVAVAATRLLPGRRLTEEGVVRARQGKRIRTEDLHDDDPTGVSPVALLDPAGAELVAIAEQTEDGLRILRGFTSAS